MGEVVCPACQYVFAWREGYKEDMCPRCMVVLDADAMEEGVYDDGRGTD